MSATGDLLVRGISELVTNDAVRPGDLATVVDAAVILRGGRVAWVGPERALPAGIGDLPVLSCGGRAALPGFVDAHTHVIFAGDRAAEFEARLAGARYEELLAAGGGILATVRATRAAGDEELAAGSYTHLRAHETPEHHVCRLLLEKKKHRMKPILMTKHQAATPT